MKARLRFILYTLTTIILVMVVGWVGMYTLHELDQLHRSFVSSQVDDFYIPAHVEAGIQELNSAMLVSQLRNDPADKVAFEKANASLSQWIHSQRQTLTTAQQRQLMDQIIAAYDVYVSQAKDFFAQKQNASLSAKPLPVRLDGAARPILDLCERLKESERDEHDRFIKDSQHALAWIQELLAVLLVILLFMVCTGIISLYTGVIGPLRVELSQSRAIAMRNEKLASLGTLAAGVAHEIRNPLTAINVRLHSLKKSLAEGSSEQEDAVVIGHEIGRLERIIQEFLQFGRPADPKLIVVSVDGLLFKIRALFSSELEKLGIQLKMESVPDIWVKADPQQMEQVLINLVKNSAESMDSGGTITLRASIGTARLSGRSQPATLIEVTDNGKGIPSGIQKQIFDPFFTTKEEGTGLGLVIASRIIERHNGSLECHSEEGRGTTFKIFLPRIKPEEINEPIT